jgi:malonate transporter and related proteins
MSSSNSAFIGYPIAAQAFGHPAAVALALNMILENGVVLPLALALAGSGDLRTRSFSRFADSLRGLERNPMMLALVAGFAVSAFGIPLPGVVTRTVRLVSSAASPVALFVIGGSLVGLSLQGMRRDVGAIASGKLLLHPLAVLAAMWLVSPIDPTLAQAGVIFASAPMMSIYAVMGQRYELQGLCAAALLVTTTASFVTISAWVAILHAIRAAGA